MKAKEKPLTRSITYNIDGVNTVHVREYTDLNLGGDKLYKVIVQIYGISKNENTVSFNNTFSSRKEMNEEFDKYSKEKCESLVKSFKEIIYDKQYKGTKRVH